MCSWLACKANAQVTGCDAAKICYTNSVLWTPADNFKGLNK